MSDFINHYLCGVEATSKVSEDIQQILTNHATLFALGCQGPDLFLYHGHLPWKKNRGYSKFGEYIHSYETNVFFTALLSSFFTQVEDINKNLHFAYIMGYLCHHALDSITHPFIFYYSGLNGNLHKKYEVILDVLHSQQCFNINPIHFDTKKITNIDTRSLKAIQDIHHHVFGQIWNQTFPLETSEVCWKDFSFLLPLFQDSSGIKSKLALFADKLIGKPFALSKAFIQSHTPLDAKEDYMNLQKKPWCHPCDNTVTFNLSYSELFQKGVEASVTRIDSLGKILLSGTPPKDLHDTVSLVIENASFETGTIHRYENHVNAIKMRYFEPKSF